MNHILRPHRITRAISGWAIAAIAALSLSLATPASYAQITSGNITGVVKDATGAVVPSATVVATNEATGVKTSVTATGTGEFLVGNLPAGIYDVKVTVSGFKPYNLKGVAVDLNKTSNTNISLTPGADTSVEVSVDSGVVIDTQSNNLTTNFTSEELTQLPSVEHGQGVLNAALLSPGVVSSGGLGIGVGGAIGGQRPRNNNFTIEGIDNNSKSVTGPLVYAPNDAVASFTVITGQFSPEFGHSSGGQFNTTIKSGTNKFHGALWEFTQNRNLDAASGTQGGKIFPIPRYDFNRYGGELGGPIFKDKLFFFGSYERNTTGQSSSYYLCTPTATGIATLNSLASSYGFSANNLAQFVKNVPVANYLGGAQVTGGAGGTDNSCGNEASGGQYQTVTNGQASTSPTYKSTQIPLGNYLVSAPNYINESVITTSMDYTVSSKDSIRARYIYNTEASEDISAALPAFFVANPYKYHLIALSEYHTFTPNLTSEFRVGFNRYQNLTVVGPQTFPGLDSFPNLQYNDLGSLQVGPDPNAPQFTIQNLYQVTENLSYVKGKHTIKIGFDGRKYISPQGFTQRARGDYEYSATDLYLHDIAPDALGQRSSGSHTYYGDQTALYGYINDTYRVTPTITLNAGLRYEFTSVPTGERSQALNSVANVAGLVSFHAPQPTYTSFAPRFGINWAPDTKTSVRAGFGIAYDVLFDNLGTLSFPPQYSITQNVGAGTACNPGSNVLPSGCQPATGSANFLADGGLAAGGAGVAVLSPAAAIAGTSALLPDQILPYAETWSLTIQRTVATNYTVELGYLGTRGIHLPTQDQINKQPEVTAANQLFTQAGSTTLVAAGSSATNLAAIQAGSAVVPKWSAAGFTSTITSYQPFSQSNYNAMLFNVTRRMQHGLQGTASYTWSKTMDDATDEVFATVLTPRRQQNSQCIACDYSRSALDHTHRLILEVLYDVPYFKHSKNFLLKNGIGNWTVSPIYTYESPEYATALSGYNSNLNGDSGSAIDRPIANPNGVAGTGSGVTAVVVGGQTVGYTAVNPNAYYIAAGKGTLPNVSRNTLPIAPINNFDLTLAKRITFFDRYSVEVGAQAFNALNHAQYVPGSVDGVNSKSYTASYNYQTVSNAFFNIPGKQFTNNARVIQLSGKINF